ncbi:hypothetical protein Tco_0169689 [Tanacetum coccineum]
MIPQSSCPFEKGYNEVVHKELGDRMERAATTASSIEVYTLKAKTYTASIKLFTASIFNAANGEVNTDSLKETASASTSENEEMEITAIIDGRVKTITEASIRRHLKLEDSYKVEDLQNDLKQTKLTYGDAYTKLIMRVKKLEHKVKASKSRRRTKIVVSDDEEFLEDPSKHGRIIAEIDQNPSISLVQDKEHQDSRGMHEHSCDEKGEKEICISKVLVSTASEIPKVSTTIPERQVYIRRSAEKRKDKGKAIMKDDESNRSFSKAEVRKNMCMYLKNKGGYKQSHFRGISYEDIRPIFERQPAEEEKLQKNDDSSKPSGDGRKKTLARKRASEKQILEEEFAMDVEYLSTKADGSSKNYKIFSERIDDFDRQDVMDLHRLVKERYATTSPEGYDLMLWGDLKTLFEPDEEDKV